MAAAPGEMPEHVLARPQPTLAGSTQLGRRNTTRRPTLLRKLSLGSSIASVGLSTHEIERPARAFRTRSDSLPSTTAISEEHALIDKSASKPPSGQEALEEYKRNHLTPSRSWVDLIAGFGLSLQHDQHPTSVEQDTRVPSPLSFSVLDPATEALRALFSSSPLKPEDAAKAEAQEAIEETSVDDLPPWARDDQKWRSTRLPLVFCHGLFGFNKLGPEAVPALQISYWRGIKVALEGLGCRVLITQVPSSASIEERATVLAETIGREMPGEEVNLIGHSMGGLDCRYMLTHLKPTNFKIRSLTTIATPHRGSPFADYMLRDIVGDKYIPKLLQLCEAIGLPGGGKAFDDLTTTSMARFNRETPDVDGVYYGSYSAKFNPGILNPFRVPWQIIKNSEGANDGLVSVASSLWGEDLGCLDNVDHLQLVGWQFRLEYSLAEWTGRKILYKPAAFYCSIADRLAERGF